MICPECGNINDDDAKFCDECGAALTGSRSKQEVASETDQKNNGSGASRHPDPSTARAGGSSVQTVRLRCPHCDGIMQADPEGRYMVCPYCGSRELILENKEVALAKLRAQERREKAREEMELARRKEEQEAQKAEKESRISFEIGRFRIVLIVLAVLASVFGATGFSSGNYISGAIGFVQAGLNVLSWLMGMRIIRTKRLNLYRVPFLLGLMLMIPYVIFFGTDSTQEPSGRTVHQWEESAIAGLVEEPFFGACDIYLSSDMQFAADVSEVTAAQYREYVDACVKSGFTVDPDRGYHDYIAFNDDGTKLELHYYDSLQEMSIRMIAPLPIGELYWPSSGPALLLPEPDSGTGLLDREDNRTLVVYVGETSRKAYADYVQRCIDSGFHVDYSREGRVFSAENADGASLRLHYYGNDIMEIDLYVPDRKES